jgi:hypothetical protein
MANWICMKNPKNTFDWQRMAIAAGFISSIIAFLMWFVPLVLSDEILPLSQNSRDITVSVGTIESY